MRVAQAENVHFKANSALIGIVGSVHRSRFSHKVIYQHLVFILVYRDQTTIILSICTRFNNNYLYFSPYLRNNIIKACNAV